MINLLKSIVREYRIEEEARIEDEIKFYKKYKNDVELLIKMAVIGITPEGKRHSHQWRIDRKAMKEMGKILIICKDLILGSKSFEEIMGIIYDLQVDGFGTLSVYDTALRIGACFDIYPEFVCLHAGALEGAKNLLGLKIDNLVSFFRNDNRYPYLYKEQFPTEVQVLPPFHIEAFLCIKKDKLLSII